MVGWQPTPAGSLGSQSAMLQPGHLVARSAQCAQRLLTSIPTTVSKQSLQRGTSTRVRLVMADPQATTERRGAQGCRAWPRPALATRANSFDFPGQREVRA